MSCDKRSVQGWTGATNIFSQQWPKSWTCAWRTLRNSCWMETRYVRARGLLLASSHACVHRFFVSFSCAGLNRSSVLVVAAPCFFITHHQNLRSLANVMKLMCLCVACVGVCGLCVCVCMCMCGSVSFAVFVWMCVCLYKYLLLSVLMSPFPM